MLRTAIKYFSICSLLIILYFLLLLQPREELKTCSRKSREHYFHQAEVWHPTNIAAANIYLGPKNEISVPPEREVKCFYVESTSPVVGFTPKFKCRLSDTGEIVRIKFSRRETLAEIAGTRLLWALGFYTDEMYPIKLRCYGCPEKDPAHPAPGEARTERFFYDAVMERNFPGDSIEQYEDQGWSWDELEQMENESSGSRKAHLGALKLAAVFLQHTDSKRSQQRLGCYSTDIVRQFGKQLCSKPVLMIQDLGATFGVGSNTVEASSAMYFKGWSNIPVWNTSKEKEYASKHPGEETCFGNILSAGEGGLTDPPISEEGRSFLVKLMSQLSDRQIRDLFRVSRVDKTEEQTVKNGTLAPVTIDDWVDAFKRKRKEIEDKRCTNQ
jgi:hypothetical protein